MIFVIVFTAGLFLTAANIPVMTNIYESKAVITRSSQGGPEAVEQPLASALSQQLGVLRDADAGSSSARRSSPF